MTDPAEKTTPIARNVLSMSDLIRLTDWARANREQCETLSNKTLATMAGETLSLYLTAANIASALEAVSITKVKPKAPPTLEERVNILSDLLSEVTLRLSALENPLFNGKPATVIIAHGLTEPDPDLLLVEHHNIIHGTDTDVKPHSESPSLPIP